MVERHLTPRESPQKSCLDVWSADQLDHATLHRDGSAEAVQGTQEKSRQVEQLTEDREIIGESVIFLKQYSDKTMGKASGEWRTHRSGRGQAKVGIITREDERRYVP